MSYDLFFNPRRGAVTRREFAAYFRERPHYKVKSGVAAYANEDTDTEFQFSFIDPADVAHNLFAHPDEARHALRFTVGYFLPSYTMQEAAQEIAAFAKEFRLKVTNPQDVGVTRGKALVLSWSERNLDYYRLVLRDPEERAGHPMLPTGDVQRIWRWNRGRNALQQKVGRTKFVPRVMFFEVDGHLGTASVWGSGVPLVAMPVTWLVIPRSDSRTRRRGLRLLEWKAAMELLGSRARKRRDTVVFDYDEAPPDIRLFLRRVPAESRPIRSFRASQVLDREAVEWAVGPKRKVKSTYILLRF